jgi:membrane-associated phospholipid phosphatase
MRLYSFGIGTWLAVLSCIGGASGHAQDSTARADSARHHVAWLTRRDAEAFGGAVAATLVLAPMDVPISREFTEPHWARSDQVHDVTGDLAFFGGPWPFIASAAIVVGGNATGFDKLQRFAIHNMEAIALATAIAGVGKGVTGRALPGVRTRHEFEWGRGFHDANGPFVSFPSGHTAAAFAMASTVAGELEHAGCAHASLGGDAAYALAGAVAVARVIQRTHWPSDLPLAIAIGTWSGQAVQAHAGDRGRIGAVLRGFTLAPAPSPRSGIAGGMQVGWSSAW